MAAAGMIGQLTVDVKEARHLNNVNVFAKMSPYITLSVGLSEERFRTRASVKGHKNPRFDQSFIFNLQGREDAIHIQVWNKNKLNDEQIGRLDLLLSSIDLSGADQWYNVVARDNFSRLVGQLLLSFRFNGKGARGSIAAAGAAVAGASSDYVDVVKPGATYVSSPSSTSSPMSTTPSAVSPSASASAPAYIYPSIEGQPPSYAVVSTPTSPPSYEAAVVAPPGGAAFVIATPIHAGAAPAYQSPVYSGGIRSTAVSPSYPGNAGYATKIAPVMPTQQIVYAPAGYIQTSSTQNGYPGYHGYAAQPPVAYGVSANMYANSTAANVVYSSPYVAQPSHGVMAVTMPLTYVPAGPPTASSTLPYQTATPTQIQMPASSRASAPYVSASTFGVQYPGQHPSQQIAGVNIISTNGPYASTPTYSSQPAAAYSSYPSQRR